MILQGPLALLKKQGCRWLGTFLSLWLVFAYLWLALFFPLMCAPYHSDAYATIDQTTAFEHTITPFSVVMSVPIDWSHYVVAENASNSAWLVDSHTDVTGLALTFISVIATPLWAWLAWEQPRATVTLLQSELYKQLHLAPLERPPRLISI